MSIKRIKTLNPASTEMIVFLSIFPNDNLYIPKAERTLKEKVAIKKILFGKNDWIIGIGKLKKNRETGLSIPSNNDTRVATLKNFILLSIFQKNEIKAIKKGTSPIYKIDSLYSLLPKKLYEPGLPQKTGIK